MLNAVLLMCVRATKLNHHGCGGKKIIKRYSLVVAAYIPGLLMRNLSGREKTAQSETTKAP